LLPLNKEHKCCLWFRSKT